MKELLLKYKSVVRFVGLFIGTYLLLGILYSVYLNLSKNGSFYPDYITHLVAKQSNAVLNTFGYAAYLYPAQTVEGMLLTIDGRYTVNIVEGCNSVSVIILFVAFIIAFAEKFKKTILYIFAGAVLIYIINIIRIAILTVALYKFPEYENVLHAVVFPGIIYGFVFILWMVWVRMLNVNPKSNLVK